MSRFDEWDRRTVAALESAYLAGGAGPRGSGAGSSSEGEWRAKRQHLGLPMDADGTWLDVGCANGHLLATLPVWASERGVVLEPHGLELMPAVADVARRIHPGLADRIWTGAVMAWEPPRRFRYVTATDDVVPPEALGDLVGRLVTFLEPGGRLIVSHWVDTGAEPRPLVDDLLRSGWTPDGVLHLDRPGRPPLQTVWFDG